MASLPSLSPCLEFQSSKRLMHVASALMQKYMTLPTGLVQPDLQTAIVRVAMTNPEYRVIDLPDGVPACLHDRPEASSSSSCGPRSSFSFGKGKPSKSAAIASKERGFDPSRALKGASVDSETASACKTRGDGLFAGGAAFRKE